MEKAKKFTIDDVKPKDRKNGYPLHVPRWYTRFFEVVPGFINWAIIISPIVFAFLGLPDVLVFYVSFLTIFWSYKGILFAYGMYNGYKRMQRDLATDWVAEINKLEGKKIPKFVLICPMIKEGMGVLQPSIQAWADSDIGSERISIVFGLEERFAHESIDDVNKLTEMFKDKFSEMVHFVHPNDIEGEVLGVKGANINWAARNFVSLVKERGEKLEDYLLITCDNDLRPHSKYLSAITYKYLTTENPLQKFYATAVHTFNNNLYRVPSLIRVQSTALTLVILHNWGIARRTIETFSSYVANLKTVDEVGYWDPEIGIDDTTFFWNAVIRYHGEFKGVEVYIPTYSDAVENATVFKTHKSLYMQQLRWGWGIIVFPMTFAGMYKNKMISLRKKIELSWDMFEFQIFYLTMIYMITFAIPLLGLFSDEFAFSSAAYNLPRVISYILTALLLLNIPLFYFKHKISPPNKEWGILRRFLDLAETFLIAVNMLTFSFLPYIQAQSELMMGKGFRKRYYATEKVQIGKK